MKATARSNFLSSPKNKLDVILPSTLWHRFGEGNEKFSE